MRSVYRNFFDVNLAFISKMDQAEINKIIVTL